MTKAHYGAVYLLGQGSQSNCTKYDTLVSCFLARYSHAGGAGRSLGCGLVAIRAVVLLPPEHVSLWRAWFPFLSATTAVLVVCAQLDDVHYQGLESHEKRSKSLPWAVMDTGSPMNIASAGDLEASQAVPVTPLGSLRR